MLAVLVMKLQHILCETKCIPFHAERDKVSKMRPPVVQIQAQQKKV